MSNLPGAEPLIYAGMWRRLFAFFADVGTFLPFAALVVVAVGDTEHNVNHLIRPILILWLTAIILSLRFSGTTPGKYTFNLDLRSTRQGRTRPAIWELAMRETVFRWMSLFVFMGYGRAFSDGRQRYWSDRMSNTVLVMRQDKRRLFTVILARSVCALGFVVTSVAIAAWAFTRYSAPNN